ncbi:MAG: DegT/DnrJ/EryC1/StrS family aminotransferase [Myxococcota bacterium]
MRIVPRHNVNWGRGEALETLRGLWGVDEEAVGRFERAFAAFHEWQGGPCLQALVFSSGRAALYMALRGLGIGVGSRVGIPAYTFYTLPAVVEALGAIPIFLPCDARTYALSPERVEGMLEGLSALLVLHPFGQSAPMEPLLRACAARDISVVEDPSQSMGACYGGRRVGGLGRVGVFSLVSGKNLTTGGGGILLTSDAELMERVRAESRSLAVQEGGGRRVRETWQECLLTTRVGYAGMVFPVFWMLNWGARGRLDALFEEEPCPLDPARDVRRLDPIQASLGGVQLSRLDNLNGRRRANAERLLGQLVGVRGLELPQVVEGCEPTYNAVAVRVLGSKVGLSAREVRRRLLVCGIDTREDYMRWYGEGEPRRDEVLYLPNHPGLSGEDMDWVAWGLRRVLRTG